MEHTIAVRSVASVDRARFEFQAPSCSHFLNIRLFLEISLIDEKEHSTFGQFHGLDALWLP